MHLCLLLFNYFVPPTKGSFDPIINIIPSSQLIQYSLALDSQFGHLHDNCALDGSFKMNSRVVDSSHQQCGFCDVINIFRWWERSCWDLLASQPSTRMTGTIAATTTTATTRMTPPSPTGSTITRWLKQIILASPFINIVSNFCFTLTEGRLEKSHNEKSPKDENKTIEKIAMLPKGTARRRQALGDR